MTSAEQRLVDAIAARMVADYLREIAEEKQAVTVERTNHPPLQTQREAA